MRGGLRQVALMTSAHFAALMDDAVEPAVHWDIIMVMATVLHRPRICKRRFILGWNGRRYLLKLRL